MAGGECIMNQQVSSHDLPSPTGQITMGGKKFKMILIEIVDLGKTELEFFGWKEQLFRFVDSTDGVQCQDMVSLLASGNDEVEIFHKESPVIYKCESISYGISENISGLLVEMKCSQFYQWFSP